MSLIFPGKRGCNSYLVLAQAWGVTSFMCAEFGALLPRAQVDTFTHSFTKGMKRSHPPQPGLRAAQPHQNRTGAAAPLPTQGRIRLCQSPVCRLQHLWTFAAVRKPLFAIKVSLVLV